MRPTARTAVAGLIVVGGIAACGSGKKIQVESPDRTTYQMLECRAFRADSTRFTVNANGAHVTLPQGHRVLFFAGAAPAGSQYDVLVGPNGGQNGNGWAELALRPVGQAPREFNELVLIRINFAMCPQAPDSLARSIKTDPPPHEYVGGVQPRGTRFVEFAAEHLTGWSIAERFDGHH